MLLVPSGEARTKKVQMGGGSDGSDELRAERSVQVQAN